MINFAREYMFAVQHMHCYHEVILYLYKEIGVR